MLKFGSSSELSLEVVSRANIANDIEIIGLTRSGVIKFNFTDSGDGSENTNSFRITDIPISLTSFSTDVNVEKGDSFVSVYLAISGEKVYKLCGGYVSVLSGISYPQTHSESEKGNRGSFTKETGADPNAGSDVFDQFTGNELWRLHAIQITLVTDANAADRRLHFNLPFGTSANATKAISSVDQVASTTVKYIIAAFGSMPTAADNLTTLIPIPPDMWMSGTKTFSTSLINKQVGDNFAAPLYFIEKFIEP